MAFTGIELNPEMDHQFNKHVPKNEALLWTKVQLLNSGTAIAKGQELTQRPVGTILVPSMDGILTCAV